MDLIDLKILRELQRDGRLTNQEIAYRVGLTPSPCLRRIRKMEADGVLSGYTAVVDPKAYGLPLTVFVTVTLDSHQSDAVEAFEAAIRRLDPVMECYLMAGASDYMLRVCLPDLDAYEAFVRRELNALPQVRTLASRFAFGTVKRSQVLPAPGTTTS